MGFELKMANEKNLHIEKSSLIFEMQKGYPATYKYDFDEKGNLTKFHGESPNVFQKIIKIVLPIWGIAFSCVGYFVFSNMQLVGMGLLLVLMGLLGVKYRESIAKKAMEEAWPKLKKPLMEKAALQQSQIK